MKKIILLLLVGLAICQANAQKLLKFKLPETGQSISYTTTPGEDADYLSNPISLRNNGNGTVTDYNTGLMWQKVDGGEMIFENAATYCNGLTLGGYTGWRLPTGIELMSINNFSHVNQALDTNYFTKTLAEYWWTSEKRVDDTTYIWVVNGGGGIGAHPKSETVSAGGTKKIHVRAVRDLYSTTFSVPHFTDNGNGTVRDNYTGLTWQKTPATNTMTWEEALAYCNTFTLAGKSDWRLPNVKELQSLNDPSIINPSFNTSIFSGLTVGDYWSSTTLNQSPTIAWDINTQYGIVTQHLKTLSEKVLLVRGGLDNFDLNITDVLIPGDTFSMGDHFGFVDPNHPSDELPIHSVKVDTFYMAKTETTNQQFLAFLNSYLLSGRISVQNNKVYLSGDTNILCYTHQYQPWYSISYSNNTFSMYDFRAYHPMVGVMWYGAAVFCNWLSTHNGLDSCYNLSTWSCDFAKNGYRLPTEAEWEWAGRAGHRNPYYNYVWGNDVDKTKANWDSSGDPYEGGDSTYYPFTTPVGFYDGALKQKADFNWPSNVTTYQTGNGANSYGLVDMAGNAWELLNDWYGQNYYSLSPYDNPKGPTSGFIMPDGKQYHGMRGGNWYNGDIVSGVSDGHSRVSNRNPSYYRGPQDPNHPWYHVGFRVARKFTGINTSLNEVRPSEIKFQNYPNPFNQSTQISFNLPKASFVTLKIFNAQGQVVATLVNEKLNGGAQLFTWNASSFSAGMYSCQLQFDNNLLTQKMLILK